MKSLRYFSHTQDFFSKYQFQSHFSFFWCWTRRFRSFLFGVGNTFLGFLFKFLLIFLIKFIQLFYRSFRFFLSYLLCLHRFLSGEGLSCWLTNRNLGLALVYRFSGFNFLHWLSNGLINNVLVFLNKISNLILIWFWMWVII